MSSTTKSGRRAAHGGQCPVASAQVPDHVPGVAKAVDEAAGQRRLVFHEEHGVAHGAGSGRRCARGPAEPGQHERERAALTLPAREIHAPAVGARHLVHEVETEAGARRVRGPSLEASEEPSVVAPPDARPVVPDGEPDLLAVAANASLDSSVRSPVLDRVLDQVEERAPDGVGIPARIAHVLVGVDGEGHPAPLGRRSHQLHGGVQQLAGSDRREPRGLVYARRGQRPLDEGLEALALLHQQDPVLARISRAFGERLAEDPDGSDGRTQLVSDAGEERLLARDRTRLPREGAPDQCQGQEAREDGEPEQRSGRQETPARRGRGGHGQDEVVDTRHRDAGSDGGAVGFGAGRHARAIGHTRPFEEAGALTGTS